MLSLFLRSCGKTTTTRVVNSWHSIEKMWRLFYLIGCHGENLWIGFEQLPDFSVRKTLPFEKFQTSLMIIWYKLGCWSKPLDEIFPHFIIINLYKWTKGAFVDFFCFFIKGGIYEKTYIKHIAAFKVSSTQKVVYIVSFDNWWQLNKLSVFQKVYQSNLGFHSFVCCNRRQLISSVTVNVWLDKVVNIDWRLHEELLICVVAYHGPCVHELLEIFPVILFFYRKTYI